MATSWQNQLAAQLNQFTKKNILIKKYLNAFPNHYHEEVTPTHAIKDILQLENVSENNPLQIDLSQFSDGTLHLRLYQYQTQIPLSDILPVLENFDLRTLSERPYQIHFQNNIVMWISDFIVTYNNANKLDIKKLHNHFKDAFMAIQQKRCEDDGFNKLVLGAGISWREVSIIRAYAKYLQQAGFRFSQAYIERTTAKYPAITHQLIELFNTLFQVKRKKSATTHVKKLNKQIAQELEKVANLEEDSILRRLHQVIQATLRTNYFQDEKNYISFKINSSAVPELPLPLPLFEIFIYSPRFEGIHLRSAKVARGGIRWSDRREDFRTEILGLMKAQKVKNSVIVPSGAKGGFVLKTPLTNAPREIIQKEVVACYQLFICGLLDITDNIVKNKIVRPHQVICYDDPDPYLVVAADKGTATFSDTANALAKKYNFWLGDAFASGGSAGYDHKKMGITARGAWESIKRHFRELDFNPLEKDFTCIGIGDMSGDVFGNGMLYTSHIKLLAAFDHRHIFLDPNPDGKTSYQERQRLFNLPTSSWEDYNSKLISAGGGVYKRSEKSIKITSQVKQALGIEEDILTPNELIRAILRAPVDLLYNGGIGTYVKASSESHAEVGDKTNEFCRINANELRCKIVGEGGNLGFTQLGRIEYALQNGLIYTDFIDNSAGVDCSDHEVNSKILLNEEVAKNKLSEKKRNLLLAKMTEDVGKLVLNDNYHQALVMSFSFSHSANYINLYIDFIKDLEANANLNRAVEFLPDDKKLLDRKNAGIGLTRPELAVLLAYTKIHIKNEILKSDLPEDDYFVSALKTAFPQQLAKLYPTAMEHHRLKREIIATQVANQVVNTMGITYAYRLQAETGASIPEIVRAFTIAAQIYCVNELHKLIDSLDFKIPLRMQYELLHHVRQLLNLASRWFLRGNRMGQDTLQTIMHYQQAIRKLENIIPTLIVGVTKTYLESTIAHFANAGIPKHIASKIAITRGMYTALNVIEVATANNLDLTKTAYIYFEVGGIFNLVWFRDQIANDAREGHWNNLARLALRDQLDMLQRNLSMVVFNSNHKGRDPAQVLQHWVDKNQLVCDRWKKLLAKLHESNSTDYTLFFIVLQEFASLIHVSR